MFFKHKVINLYQVLLDKFHMNFTGTRKQSLTTDQNSANKTLVIVNHIVARGYGLASKQVAKVSAKLINSGR